LYNERSQLDLDKKRLKEIKNVILYRKNILIRPLEPSDQHF